VTEPAQTRPDQGTPGGVAEQVRALMEAAEGTARAIRQEAEADAARMRGEALDQTRVLVEKAKADADAEAARYLEEARRRADAIAAERMARISELGDSLIARAEALSERLDHAAEMRRQLDALVQAIAGTAERLAREAVMPPDAEPAPAPAEQREPLRAVEEPPSQGLEDARLVALQMAVAGKPRQEVTDHVRRSFDVGEPEKLVEEVFANLDSGAATAG
jgi:hypothetical protein